jgi:hypothetical protein
LPQALPGLNLIQKNRVYPAAMLNRIMSLARLDFSARHRQPSAGRVLLATIASLAASLAADALLVVIGEAIFPSTKGYVHFQFSDYGKLTVIGVIIACVAWPVVTRVSDAPRWLFFRLAILVTLFLWLPDLYILYRGQPGDAVAVLMVMHLAIAVVTYNLLVHIAAIGPAARTSRHRAPASGIAASPPEVRSGGSRRGSR